VSCFSTRRTDAGAVVLQDGAPVSEKWAEVAAAFLNDCDKPQKSAAFQVMIEREKQISKGYGPAHDDAHTGGELMASAIAYFSVASAMMASGKPVPAGLVPPGWPFKDGFNPDPENIARNLILAASFLAAEADRLTRAGKEGASAHVRTIVEGEIFELGIPLIEVVRVGVFSGAEIVGIRYYAEGGGLFIAVKPGDASGTLEERWIRTVRDGAEEDTETMRYIGSYQITDRARWAVYEELERHPVK
jgi:hypothetical protein